MNHDFDIEKILEHLRTCKHKKLILDTDTGCEIDDQFAITYALLADDIDLLAITAAPFYNPRVDSVKSGTKASYDEILHVLSLIDPENKLNTPVYLGADDYMKNQFTPQVCEAAENIGRIVNEADDIVYIAMIGCYTNVASAILLHPEIIDKAVIVMIGGQKPYMFDGDANEYNLGQDRNAARIIMSSGIPVVTIPAGECSEQLYTFTGEMYYFCSEGRSGRIGDYLVERYDEQEFPSYVDGKCNSNIRTIWDIAAIAFIRNPDKAMKYFIEDSKTIDAAGKWRPLNNGRKMIMADYISRTQRNFIYSDFFNVLKDADKYYRR